MLTSTFQQALRDGLRTEGLGLDTVIDGLKNLPLRLWDALYDGQGGRLTEPETVIKVLRKAIGPGVQ